MVFENNNVTYAVHPDFPHYRVGSDGSLWTCLRTNKKVDPNTAANWRLHIGNADRRGYRQHVLTDKNGRQRTMMLHTLVIESFRGRRPNGQQCRHLNGKSFDCRLENLVWGSSWENHQDKRLHGTTPQGVRNGRAKLTAKQVALIPKLYKLGFHQWQLAEHFGVTQPLIGQIIRGRLWAHVTGIERR